MDFTKISFKKQYMTVSEISKLLSVSNFRVRKTVKDNNFRKTWEKYRSNNKGLGRWLINMDDYAEYINKLNP